MALIRMGPLAQAISGSLGACTFARHQGRAVVRRRPLKIQPYSQTAALRRARFVRAIKAWVTLPEIYRLQWTAAAPLYTFHDRLGQPYTPSPRRLFEWYNTWLYTRRGFYYFGPPAYGRHPAPTVVSVDFAAGGPYNITLSMAPLMALTGYYFDGATAHSLSKWPTRTPAYFHWWPVYNDVPYNLFTPWTAVLPPLVSGEKFLLRLWAWTLNYAQSFPVIIKGTCA